MFNLISNEQGRELQKLNVIETYEIDEEHLHYDIKGRIKFLREIRDKIVKESKKQRRLVHINKEATK